MKRTDTLPTLSDIEADARRLQAEAVAHALRTLMTGIRDAFGGATVHGNGRTA
ncbi:RSP_7527 family protein [Rhodovulum sp. DZ06]|uniref:RSP_7527 family protein n=1 Tax=Rhodovulum sp. DZ06 TaxID=3425126 RepID=UPI003D341901